MKYILTLLTAALTLSACCSTNREAKLGAKAGGDACCKTGKTACCAKH